MHVSFRLNDYKDVKNKEICEMDIGASETERNEWNSFCSVVSFKLISILKIMSSIFYA